MIKPIIKKNKSQNKYLEGIYVALDEKDRIISFDKNKDKVLSDVNFYHNYLKEYQVRIYKLIDYYVGENIRALLG